MSDPLLQDICKDLGRLHGKVDTVLELMTKRIGPMEVRLSIAERKIGWVYGIPMGLLSGATAIWIALKSAFKV